MSTISYMVSSTYHTRTTSMMSSNTLSDEVSNDSETREPPGRRGTLVEVPEEEDSEDEVDRALAVSRPRASTARPVEGSRDATDSSSDTAEPINGGWGWTSALANSTSRAGWWTRRRTAITVPDPTTTADASTIRGQSGLEDSNSSQWAASSVAAEGEEYRLPVPRSRPGTPRSTSLAGGFPRYTSRASTPFATLVEETAEGEFGINADSRTRAEDEGSGGTAEVESDGEGEKLCRICFTGEDDDEDDEDEDGFGDTVDDDGQVENDGKAREKRKEEGMGRLISPCLCRGSMRHVHISCLQQWRGKGRNKKAYMECTQCKFRYRLRRTRFLGIASSPIILLITSLVLFLVLTLATGSALHWLMRFSRFRRIVAGPTERQPRMVKLIPKKNRISRWIPFQMEDTQEEFEAAVRHDPLVPIGIELPGGFTYMQPSSGMFELVIRSMRAFINGEAQEVGEGMWQVVLAGADWLEVYKAGHYALLPFRLIAKAVSVLGLGTLFTWLQPVIERFSLGFSLVGSISFATLLITSSFMMPFQLANNVRIGRGGGPFGLPMGALGGRRRAAQARAATMPTGQLGTVGIGSLVLVMFVVMGAVRAITQLYSFTNYLAVVLLTKAENAILEVNRRGEVIEDARAITMQEGGRMVQVVD